MLASPTFCAVASTMAFATLCLSRLFHGFNCKSGRPVLFTRAFWNNKFLLGAFARTIETEIQKNLDDLLAKSTPAAKKAPRRK